MGLVMTVGSPAVFLMGRGASPLLLRLGGNGLLSPPPPPPPPRGAPLNGGRRFLGKSAIASALTTTNASFSRLTLKSQNLPTALVVNTPLSFNLKYLALSVGLRGACLIFTTKLFSSKDW